MFTIVTEISIQCLKSIGLFLHAYICYNRNIIYLYLLVGLGLSLCVVVEFNGFINMEATFENRSCSLICWLQTLTHYFYSIKFQLRLAKRSQEFILGFWKPRFCLAAVYSNLAADKPPWLQQYAAVFEKVSPKSIKCKEIK